MVEALAAQSDRQCHPAPGEHAAPTRFFRPDTEMGCDVARKRH